MADSLQVLVASLPAGRLAATDFELRRAPVPEPADGEVLWRRLAPVCAQVAHVVYEAGPTGYALQRQLRAAGIGCTVIAPSLTDTPLAGALLNSDLKKEAAAIGVDRLLGVTEAVVRPLPVLADASPYVAGASLGADQAFELDCDRVGYEPYLDVRRRSRRASRASESDADNCPSGGGCQYSRLIRDSTSVRYAPPSSTVTSTPSPRQAQLERMPRVSSGRWPTIVAIYE